MPNFLAGIKYDSCNYMFETAVTSSKCNSHLTVQHAMAAVPCP